MHENVGFAPLGTGVLNLILALKLKDHAFPSGPAGSRMRARGDCRKERKTSLSHNEKVFSALTVSTDCVTEDLYQKWETSSVDK